MVRTSGENLFNENFMGDLIYGQKISVKYLDVQRIGNNPNEVFNSEYHHPRIFDKVSLDGIREMRCLRTTSIILIRGFTTRH